jgi:hypothetical protein
MVDEYVRKIAIITKKGFFEWNVMLFILKNATNTFFRTMAETLRNGMTNLLNFLWMMSTSIIMIGVNTWSTSSWFLKG